MSTIEQSNSNTTKDFTISMCKGIAILLMVLGHAGVDRCISSFISMFHMPLFFFFSGYCFKSSYIDKPKLFITKRIKGLYIPYVKWMILFILLHNCFCELKLLDLQSVGFYSYGQILEKILRTIFTFVGGEQLLGGFWFLRELFWGALIAYFMLKYLKNIYLVLSISLICALLCHLTSWHLPSFGIGYTSFMASSYFVSGYIFKDKSVKSLTPMLTLAAYIIVALGSLFWYLDAVRQSAYLVLPYYLTAIIGVWATFSLCKQIKYNSKNLLVYIGNNTMTILTWHFLVFKLVSYFFIAIYDLPLERLGDFPFIGEMSSRGGWILYFIVGSIVPLLLNICFCKLWSMMKTICSK